MCTAFIIFLKCSLQSKMFKFLVYFYFFKLLLFIHIII